MAVTALDLYSEAYARHYKDNDIEKACVLYKEIIRRFPESNECAYAGLQLEKIGATLTVAESGLRRRIVALLLACNILFLAGLIGVAALGYLRLDTRIESLRGQIRVLRAAQPPAEQPDPAGVVQ
jgi:hypothetical protein